MSKHQIEAHPVAWQLVGHALLRWKPAPGRVELARRTMEAIEGSVDLCKDWPNPWGLASHSDREQLVQHVGVPFDRGLRAAVNLDADGVELLLDVLREVLSSATLHDQLILGHAVEAMRAALRG